MTTTIEIEIQHLSNECLNTSLNFILLCPVTIYSHISKFTFVRNNMLHNYVNLVDILLISFNTCLNHTL